MNWAGGLADRVDQSRASGNRRTALPSAEWSFVHASTVAGLGEHDAAPEPHRIGRVALTVVKAIVPSLVPISFGYGREPRAMVADCDPRSFFPHPFP